MKQIKLLKRWFDMLRGKSVFHVEQGIGKYYEINSIKGYYNDLTGKVNEKTQIDDKGIPITTTITGVKAYFPIAIFQYGLGAYDLYLGTKDKKYNEIFLKIADWAVNNIKDNGMWDCMGTLKDSKHYTQSAMCQSEGVSLLIRAYIESNNKKYIDCAKKAIEFMITDDKHGGTCTYDGEKIIFQEYVCDNDNIAVLNGWVFSIFGLYDYAKYSNDKKYKEILKRTLKTLAIDLPKYDRKYWSNYDQKGTIASPAYHDLHIKQLKLLYELFHIDQFINYAEKWEKCENSKLNKIMAMLIKLKQKVLKSKYYDINTSTVS